MGVPGFQGTDGVPVSKSKTQKHTLSSKIKCRNVFNHCEVAVRICSVAANVTSVITT